MFLKEVSVERIAFSCGGCGHQWSADYDVQHVDDGHGHDRDYYFYEGVPCPDPTVPGSVLCPRCSRGTIWVELTARRASPAVTRTESGDLGAAPRPGTTEARGAAPMISGAETSGAP